MIPEDYIRLPDAFQKLFRGSNGASPASRDDREGADTAAKILDEALVRGELRAVQYCRNTDRFFSLTAIDAASIEGEEDSFRPYFYAGNVLDCLAVPAPRGLTSPLVHEGAFSSWLRKQMALQKPRNTAASATNAEKYLRDLFRELKENGCAPENRKKYLLECQELFGISGAGFKRVWAAVAKDHPDISVAGRRPKQPARV